MQGSSPARSASVIVLDDDDEVVDTGAAVVVAADHDSSPAGDGCGAGVEEPASSQEEDDMREAIRLSLLETPPGSQPLREDEATASSPAAETDEESGAVERYRAPAKELVDAVTCAQRWRHINRTV